MIQHTPRLALSRRQTARSLGIRQATVTDLVRRGLLREVPWGSRRRIPLEDVERLAREGFTCDGPARRRRTRTRPGTVDPDALRRLDVESLRRCAP